MSYNIPAPHSRLRPIPFSIDKSKWTLSNGVYTATYETPYITGTSVEWVEYSSTYRTSIRGDVDWIKANGGGGITFITTEQPVGTLEGIIKTIVNNDGRLTLVTQETALPTLRDVPFTLDVDDWTLNETTGMYEIVWETNYITATSHDWLEFDESIENATDAIKIDKAYDDGEVVGMKFISRRCPADDISGKITTLDNADGKVAVVLQDTVMPISAGGTGANTLAGAKENLGITELNSNLTANNSAAGVTNIPFRFGCDDDGNYGYVITEGGADTVIPFKNSEFSKCFDQAPIIFGLDTKRQRNATSCAVMSVDTKYFEIISAPSTNYFTTLTIKAKKSFSLRLVGGFYYGGFGFAPVITYGITLVNLNTTISITKDTEYVVTNQISTNNEDSASACFCGFIVEG